MYGATSTRAILQCAFALAFAYAFITIYLLWDIDIAVFDDASTAAKAKLLSNRPKAMPAQEKVAHVVRAPLIFKDHLNATTNAVADDPDKNHEAILRPNERFDVIDVGSSNAGRWGSMHFLRQALSELGDRRKKGALDLDPRTLGLDNDPNKVMECNGLLLRRGSRDRCALADILTLTPDALGARKISGNTFWHVLEHIPDCALAEEMWIKAAALSSSFSGFHGPAFDREMSRAGEVPTGHHRFWENWHGHQCHFNSTMLDRAMRGVAKTTALVIVNYGRLTSTDHPIVVPPGTPADSHHYDPNVMLPKESRPLPDGLYEEMRGCAVYDEGVADGRIGLFAALCLRDALHLRKAVRGAGLTGGFDVVSCSVGRFEGEECMQALSFMVTEAIVRYFNTDIKRVREIT